MNFDDAILDIDIGLDGRDKELCKPLLQLFNDTKSHEEIRATLQSIPSDVKNTSDIQNNYEESSYNVVEAINSTTQNDDKDPPALMEPSLPSLPSPNEAIEQQIPNSIYRVGHSDRWACNYCSVTGDKWFMLTHPEYCKGRNRSKQTGR